ncbi:Alcohol dehydrogenase, class IV [Limimonas halophila]|uniref:Alcohol dehydrogenase 2 n=1 Tax=Limimonas halophila TaxID=1082479 RepID=A0A1G7LJ33_9PROT|nr:iron-containing alcohol dehydrogenase [Limimonas halophila]SDF49461.1 Alcohol dehydrogenase, class IV [Limimonas halophila]
MTATFMHPRILQLGGGAIDTIGDTLAKTGVRHPLIVTDPEMARLPAFERLTGALDAAGVSYGTFTGVVPDPTTTAVDAGVAAYRDGGHDGMIGFGGGSSLDTAKAIGILLGGGGQMRDWKVPAAPDVEVPPLIAVPTTAGTGSEVTKVTVITDVETDEKMLIMGLSAVPAAAIVDYTLTLGKPFRLTADTGLDSLTHGIEAYVSRKANPHTDTFALSAMRVISANIRRACFHGDDHDAREAMMLGAMHGGMAFANASVCLVHGMSRPIGAFFHVPHGMSNAMLLPEITAFSVEAAPERYATCARTMGVTAPDSDDATACDDLIAALRQLNRDLEVPTPKSYGIDPERYQAVKETMAEQALASGSPGNNPRQPSKAEIMDLYDRVWA